MLKSIELAQTANQYLIGGVIAGGRYNPILKRALYFSRGQGSRLWDVDGKEYIDFFTGSGANFMGHAHPALDEAVTRALEVGVLCNGETEYQSELARMISEAVPCAEKIRLQNSGTEATAGAIRIARAHTGKSKILKFEGHFHGMHDYLWFNCATAPGAVRDDGTIRPVPDSDGIPQDMSQFIVVVPFNDPDAFDAAIQAHKDELAAVIMEPISFNQGCVPADADFIRHIREACTRNGIVLIFDEVLSGFRMCRGGAQEYYGVTPDMCTLAKALGGGVPISAICGRTDIMQVLGPVGHTVISGTYTGHLIAVMVAIACQKELAKPETYQHINSLADQLYGGIGELLSKHGIPGVVRGVGARFGIYFGLSEAPKNYWQATQVSREMELKFLTGCLERGLYFNDYAHRTPMHHGFSVQHSQADIAEALNRIDDILKDIK